MADTILHLHRHTISLPFERAGAWWYVAGARRADLGNFGDLPPGLCAFGSFTSELDATANRNSRLVRLLRLMTSGANGFGHELDPENWVFIERQVVPVSCPRPIHKARTARR